MRLLHRWRLSTATRNGGRGYPCQLHFPFQNTILAAHAAHAWFQNAICLVTDKRLPTHHRDGKLTRPICVSRILVFDRRRLLAHGPTIFAERAEGLEFVAPCCSNGAHERMDWARPFNIIFGICWPITALHSLVNLFDTDLCARSLPSVIDLSNLMQFCVMLSRPRPCSRPSLAFVSEVCNGWLLGKGLQGNWEWYEPKNQVDVI